MRISVLIVLVGCIFMVSCSPVTRPYYYIALEPDEDLRILKSARIKSSALSGNGKIPKEYLLDRSDYKIRFYIRDGVHLPHIWVVLENSISGEHRVLLPERNAGIISPKGIICASIQQQDITPREFGFGWSSDCVAKEIEKSIEFYVFDVQTKVKTKEVMSFKLEQDGFYTIFDAL